MEVDEEKPHLIEYLPTDDDKYVGQFLSIGDIDLGSFQMEEPAILEEIPQLIEEEIAQPEERPLVVEKAQKKRSTFHNFQKHLVTTIRAVIDPSQLGKDPETRSCEVKMWKIFMNSNKINKTLVTIVFGGLGV